MRLRCFFDCGAGVCLWAADAAARSRFGYAVELASLPLRPETRASGEALMAAHAEFVEATLAGSPPEEAAVERWRTTARAWLGALRAELGPEVMVEDALEPPPEAAIESACSDERGRVIACFETEEFARHAQQRLRATRQWRETAEFDLAAQPDWLPELPGQLLEACAELAGFVVAWHQEAEGGPSLFLAGDPVEHAIACVRDRNVTGWVNCLCELRTRTVLVSADLLAEPWHPTAAHRLTSGDAEEWAPLFAAVGAAVNGRSADAGLLEQARERLLYGWRERWPAQVAEALRQAGFTRAAFLRFER